MVFLVSNYDFIRYNSVGFFKNFIPIKRYSFTSVLYEFLVVCFLILSSKGFLITSNFFYLVYFDVYFTNLLLYFLSLQEIFLNNFFIFDG
jgi:hypothetical protein